MVRHLGNAQRRRAEPRCEALLRLALRVAGQDERDPAVPQSMTIESSFRTFIRSQSAGGGCQTCTRTPPAFRAAPADTPRHENRRAPARARRSASGFERRDRHPFPDFARTEVLEHGPRATDVVGIAVREHEPVETPDSPRPERRRDHTRADIEAAAESAAAGIDQHRAAVRELDERGVALRHVDRGHPEDARRRAMPVEIETAGHGYAGRASNREGGTPHPAARAIRVEPRHPGITAAVSEA